MEDIEPLDPTRPWNIASRQAVRERVRLLTRHVIRLEQQMEELRRDEQEVTGCVNGPPHNCWRRTCLEAGVCAGRGKGG
jgi:hypothetical protein